MEKRACKRCGAEIGLIPRKGKDPVPVDLHPFYLKPGRIQLGVTKDGEIIRFENEQDAVVLWEDIFPAHFKTCKALNGTKS